MQPHHHNQHAHCLLWIFRTATCSPQTLASSSNTLAEWSLLNVQAEGFSHLCLHSQHLLVTPRQLLGCSACVKGHLSVYDRMEGLSSLWKSTHLIPAGSSPLSTLFPSLPHSLLPPPPPPFYSLSQPFLLTATFLTAHPSLCPSWGFPSSSPPTLLPLPLLPPPPPPSITITSFLRLQDTALPLVFNLFFLLLSFLISRIKAYFWTNPFSGTKVKILMSLSIRKKIEKAYSKTE